MNIRPMTDGDVGEVVALLERALGPAPGGADRRELFEWKHLANPAGRSIALLGVEDDRIVGVRMFMKWRFAVEDTNSEARHVLAVRAVDTATDPDLGRRGVFSALTKAGLAQCERDGVQLVFNTPNERSRPGYLKMGWSDVATWPMSIRVRSPLRLATAAARRDLKSGSAVEPPPGSRLRPAEELFRDRSFAALLDRATALKQRLSTERSLVFLRWRYTQGPIPYVSLTDVSTDGSMNAALIARIRSRGRLRELVVCDVVGPPGASDAAEGLLKGAAGEAGADHAVGFFGGDSPWTSCLKRAGYRRVPRGGMIFTVRPVERPQAQESDGPSPLEADNWTLSLGDLELF